LPDILDIEEDFAFQGIIFLRPEIYFFRVLSYNAIKQNTRLFSFSLKTQNKILQVLFL